MKVAVQSHLKRQKTYLKNIEKHQEIMKGREVQEYKALAQIDIRAQDIMDLSAQGITVQDMVQNITAQDMD